jgi:hypothetical protein
MSQDPPRLKDAAATPPELGEALKALREPTRDAARIARVEQQLGGLLDAPPPAAGAVGVQAAMQALRWLFVGCVGAGVLWLGSTALLSKSPKPEAQTPQVPPASVPLQPAPTLYDEPAQQAPAQVSVDQVPDDTRIPAARRSQRTPRSDAPSRARGSAAAHGAHMPLGASSSAATPANVQATSPGHVEPIAAATPVAPRPASAPQDAGAEVRPKSEVELLFEARAMRGSQPRDALRLLDDHAKRFGDGMLAPEREVMAIEILRSLGQTADADARLARFRARYPKSLHLRRLEQSAPR